MRHGVLSRRELHDVLYERWYRMLYAYGGTPRADRPSVCPRWRTSFESFCDDVGPPSHGRDVLCLRNRERGYRPGNVYWGSRGERQQRVAHARIISFNGKRLSLSGWAREIQLDRGTLRKRLATLPINEALSRRKYANRHRPQQAKSTLSRSDTVGVYWREKSKRWEAKVRWYGKLHYIGLFRDKRDAVEAVTDFRRFATRELLAKQIRRSARRGVRRPYLLARLRELITLDGHDEFAPVIDRGVRVIDPHRAQRSEYNPLAFVRSLTVEQRRQFRP